MEGHQLNAGVREAEWPREKNLPAAMRETLGEVFPSAWKSPNQSAPPCLALHLNPALTYPSQFIQIQEKAVLFIHTSTL